MAKYDEKNSFYLFQLKRHYVTIKNVVKDIIYNTIIF